MAGVVVVFVREDECEAETLAEAFDAAGFSISSDLADDDSIAIVVWSRAALRSIAFRAASECALRAGRAVIVALTAPPNANMLEAPLVDLSDWDGEDGAALDPLFEAVDGLLHPVRSNVIALPSRPVYVDAEFTEAAPAVVLQQEREQRARQAWEAPIPTEMLRPVKLGATAPRHDFRRAKTGTTRPHAALAVAAVMLVGSVLALGGATMFTMPAPRAVPVAQPAADQADGAVSFASASAEAIGLEDVAPLIDPAAHIGRAGVEPGSARPVRRSAVRRIDQREQAAYQAPALIPDTILAELDSARTPMRVAEHGPEPRS